MKNKRFNLKNFRKGRILRVEELKIYAKNKEPVWVYVKEYSKPKATTDQAELGLLQDSAVRFLSCSFDFKNFKDKDNCSADLKKTALIKIYKALPTKREKK